MADDLVRALRERYDQINGLLDNAGAPAELDAAKRDIIAFFKHVDGLVAELGALKEDIRQLVDRYKQMAEENRATASAPEFSGEKPVVHADHIGASTFIQKGWSLLSLGDYPGAIQSLTHALELSPQEIEAESLLGWAQMLGEDYDGALGTFQKVLMQEPGNSLARINVGYICYKKRIFGEAIEHLSKAIRMANDKKATLYAHFYLGLVYLEREMFEDAESFFQKAIELGPNMTEAFFEMGRAQWFAGNAEGAQATWRSGVTASKFSPGGKKCAKMLDRIAAGGEPPRPGADALD
jgi:tetratricopeptide (TPR) repeat protein